MNGAFTIKRGAVTLCSGTATDAFVSDGPHVNGQRLLDVVPFLFADRPTIFDRETDSDTVTFTISTQHASLTEAMDHALRHGRATRGVEDLVIELTDGASTMRWQIADAGWRSHAVPAPTGLSTAVQYTVECPFIPAPETIEGGELTGDLDGGADDGALVFTDDFNCQSGRDDDGSIVETFDAGEEAA